MPADGVPPKQTRLLGPFTFRGQPLQVDGQGRVYLVTEQGERLVRFDLAANKTEVLVKPFFERTRLPTGPPDGNLSEGAPIGNVDFGWFESICIDPEMPDQLYVLDVYFELAWRLDVERNRCYLVAGDSSQTKPLFLGGPTRVRLTDVINEYPTSIAARGGVAMLVRLIFREFDPSLDEGQFLIIR